MVAQELLENFGHERVASNQQRSEELLLQIFETLSEGIIRFSGRTSTKDAQQVSTDFMSCRLSVTDLILKEKEIL